jgi:hypothetical protein
VTRNKGLSGNLKNTEEEVLTLNQEENNTQDTPLTKKNENMKKTRISPPPAIPTKNRFEVLQAQDPIYHSARITHNQLQQMNHEYKIRSWKS